MTHTLFFDDADGLVLSVALEALAAEYAATALRLTHTSSAETLAEIGRQTERVQALLVRVNEARR